MQKIISNPVLDRLPNHLRQYIKPQNYDLYTAQDQAVWRYVMRNNIKFLKMHAHESYLEGLLKTGISANEIPSMYGMNRILQEIGWAVAAVDGLIPPAAFMEFQAYNVLVIASDIRSQNNIEYTPAPDIIHETTGHAPILANAEYAEYLRRFGMIGSKAITSKYDDELFQAVRKLSILKESKNTSAAAIDAAEAEIESLQNLNGELSEMAMVRNLHWWSVEYGLIGKLTDFKLYGAGLLSSISESKLCLSNKVKKLDYTIEAAYQSFDVTKRQPQLFVTPDFANLSNVLEELANTLSVRNGGLEGVKKLILSEELGTIELSTGVQISGIFTKVRTSLKDPSQVAYVHTEGATALSNRDKELIAHGIQSHPDGFGTAIGRLRGIHLAIEYMSPRDLEAYKISEGQFTTLEFETGVVIKGKVIAGTRNLYGKIQLITFSDCTVTFEGEILYKPNWGIYHLAIGKEIRAAYAGPADCTSFDLMKHNVNTETIKVPLTEDEKLFQEVADYSEGKTTNLEHLWEKINSYSPKNWLLILNFYEANFKKNNQDYCAIILDELTNLMQTQPENKHLIEKGLSYLQTNTPSDYANLS
jgi:phenylalanine-4-hydroxylase